MHSESMEKQQDFDKQTLTEHLTELRSCLLVSFGAAFAGFCVAYGFVRPLSYWFLKPLVEVLPPDTSLIFTSYQEGFFFI